MKDVVLEYPELWMEIFVAGDKSEEQAFANMLIRARCTKAESPEKADIVLFTGGPDVNPILYDEDRHHTTGVDTQRDRDDMELYDYCLANGIPMFGVCRGAQFLHVMNHGKLYQDVDGHVGDHIMWDVPNKKVIQKVSSVHHQMVIRNERMIVLGESSAAKARWKSPTDCVRGQQMDVEAFFYRDTHCLGVQGHPEYRDYNRFMQWTLEKINEYIVCSPDTESVGNLRRLKADFIKERQARHAEMAKEKAKELN